MVTSRNARAPRALALLGVLGVVLAGCIPLGGPTTTFKAGPGVDVTSRTITLGILAPLSGQVAVPIGLPVTHGVELYFKEINDNGGIDGFKVNLVEKDSKYDPTAQVKQYEAIRNQVAMIAESLGTPTTHALIGPSAADQMLISAATLDSYLARQQYVVLVGTPYRLQVENAFDYVVNRLHVSGPPTAIMYQNDAYGQDALQGYKESVAAYHLQDVAQTTYNPADTSFAAQASRLQASGAKYVFLAAIPTAAAGVMVASHELGYDPQWILQSPAWAPALLADPNVAPLLQKHAWVVGQGASWGDTTKPGMDELLGDVAKYAPDQGPDSYFEFGFTEAKITGAILKRAADNQDLSRAGLLNAFDSLGTVDLGGLYPNAHYGTTPNDRVPSRDNIIYAVDPSKPGDIRDISGDFVGTAAEVSQF